MTSDASRNMHRTHIYSLSSSSFKNIFIELAVTVKASSLTLITGDVFLIRELKSPFLSWVVTFLSCPKSRLPLQATF